MRLDLPYQKLWFRMAHPNGRMRVTALRITEQMAIFEARVFLDRSDAEPFSMSVAQQQLQDNRDFIRGAQNEALSQALTDAGFGIQLISADAQDAVGQKKADATEKKAAEAAPIQVERTESRRRLPAPLRSPLRPPWVISLPTAIKRAEGTCGPGNGCDGPACRVGGTAAAGGAC